MTKPVLPLKIFAWCFVVFVAAFMPWGVAGFMTMPFFGGTITQTATGWNGSINFLGILVPNWIEVAIAAVIATVSWLRATGTEIKSNLVFWLAFYGVLHAAIFIFGIITRSLGQLGIGSVATLLAFLIIMFSRRTPTGTGQNSAA